MTLPPLFASMPMSMDFPGSPQARSKGLSLSSAQVQHNDIDAHELLGEIEMDMYGEYLLFDNYMVVDGVAQEKRHTRGLPHIPHIHTAHNTQQ